MYSNSFCSTINVDGSAATATATAARTGTRTGAAGGGARRVVRVGTAPASVSS